MTAPRPARGIPRDAPPTHRIELNDGCGWWESHPLAARSDQAACNAAGRACDRMGYGHRVTVIRLADGATRERRAHEAWPRGGFTVPRPPCSCDAPDGPHALVCARVLGAVPQESTRENA